MQIFLQVKGKVLIDRTSCGLRSLKENIARKRESSSTTERTIQLLNDGNPAQSVAKDLRCSPSAQCKIWCKYKQNVKVIKLKLCE